MDFFEVVKARHSYRGAFKNQAIPEGDLNKLLDAARRAPSGYNQQTTEMVVITDPVQREKLNAIFPHEGIASAPVNIVLVSSKVDLDGLVFELQDYSAMAEHIWLAATALGYATVWTDGDTALDGKAEAIGKLLGVPADRTVRAVMPIGIPKEAGTQGDKKSIADAVHFESF